MRTAAMIVLSLSLSMFVPAAQNDADEAEQVYDNRSFARLSYLTGSIFIQKASDLAYEEGEINMPIVEGDRLGTTDGRVEIHLGNGAYLRLDHETKLDVLSLPTLDDDLTRLRLWSGSIFLSLDRLEREKSYEIHTSDVSLYLLDQGLYRIDVREDQETQVFVFSGMAEAAGESESLLVKDAQRLEIIQGRFTNEPIGFNAVPEDSFDRWNEFRDLQARKQPDEYRLPEELEDYETELDEAGEWEYEPLYGSVWVPHGLPMDWRPYWNGRWMWYSSCGWTWLPHEPWGWVTFHFGRWHWNVSFGWYWIPTRHWGPAWVSWYSWGDYWGWAPMSYYGYPGAVVNNIYYPRYSGTYHPYNSRTLTVIHKDQIKARSVSNVALSRERITAVGQLARVEKAPMERPDSGNVSVQRLGDRKVFLHSTGEEAPFRKPASGPAAKVRGGTGTASPAGEGTARIRSSGSTRERIGYPSSPEITGKSRSGNVGSVSNSRSPVSRFYDSITERGSRVTRRKIAGQTPASPESKVRSGGVRGKRPPTIRTPSRSTASSSSARKRSGTTGTKRTTSSRSSSKRTGSGTKTKKK